MDNFAVRTSTMEKKNIDEQVARFIFATNSSFRIVEHPEFKKACSLLRPGYEPPNRRQIGGKLLDDVYLGVIENAKISLMGKHVCMALDGWSNVHNEPVICVSVLDLEEHNSYLIDTFDTTDNSHTAEYLIELACQSIEKCHQIYGCIVRSFVTDNAANMTKMRNDLMTIPNMQDTDIITYGCSAHLLNLLAHDIETTGVKDEIKLIIKYFRNHHIPGAKYKQARGSALKLPSDVRWNTLSDCLESYIENWHILAKVCSENRTVIDSSVAYKVNDFSLKINAEIYLRKMKLVAGALDKAQSDKCTISEMTEEWIKLQRVFDEEFTLSEIASCNKRAKQALTPPHFAAHLTDPRYRGISLNANQFEVAMDYFSKNYPDIMPEIINYQAKAFPFKEYLFICCSTAGIQPLTWWKALEGKISSRLLLLMQQLHSAAPSSAGIERIFSTYGLVHSKLRNCLGNEKAAKLVAIYKNLNTTNHNL